MYRKLITVARLKESTCVLTEFYYILRVQLRRDLVESGPVELDQHENLEAYIWDYFQIWFTYHTHEIRNCIPRGGHLHTDKN